MLFVTNRVMREGPTPYNPDGSLGVPRRINFDLRNNQAEQSVYFCRRDGADNYTEIGSQTFFDQLRNSDCRQLLFFLHGYSSLPEPAIFPRANELQQLFDLKSRGQVQVIPLIWPCGNRLGAIRDYFDDQIAADASAFAFARMFQKFLTWRDEHSTLEEPCVKPLNVLAHSMGNRVLRGTMVRSVEYYQPAGVPLVFRNTFMVAADIENTSLDIDREGRLISDASRNVVVYYAADDLAMRASKVANGSPTSRRMGHTGPARMENVAVNVFSIDCGDFNNDYDPPTGHGYFASDPNGNPGIAFNHIWECIRTGRVPTRTQGVRRFILTP
ncbi:alpha/beta hydrolase [Pantanalinema rosaneae CENA516]|uniref:alpha/beta hydrolase n=1 Tax=Pantanalinema rosaneae TaxID=1620701 RepID=UPI003D6F3042